MKTFLAPSAAFVLVMSLMERAAFGQTPARDLTGASLEELMEIQVTSVSRKEQSLAKVGAAIFVISSDDIRRSGASNIPDVLRMAPGVEVAQIDAHTWAITIRGFNDRYANKVLVMIDGRTVYTPLTSGVNWDQQDVPLEDIERIEVIRGPGGTVWGANAVNGVINITTRSSTSTQGGLITAGSGSRENASGLIQYGGKIGQSETYRVFGNYSDIANSPLPDGSRAPDGSSRFHGGFRSDWAISPRDSLTVEGDISRLSSGQSLTGEATSRVTVGAGDAIARWNRTLSSDSDITLQVYYDRYNRFEESFREVRDTVDFDFHHHLKLGPRHDLVWGLGYRVTTDNVSTGTQLSYVPPRQTGSLFSAFVQDEIRLAGPLSLTLGSKVEHNSYTGVEFEPGAQIVWRLTGRQQLWASASRAIRQPSRADEGIQVDVAKVPLPDGGFGIVRYSGDDVQSSEDSRDFEVGYRSQLGKRISLDVATFGTLYRHLATLVPQDPFFTTVPVPHLVIPSEFEDAARGQSYGGEVSVAWNVTDHWKLSPSYSMIHIKLDRESIQAGNTDATTPRNQMQIRSLLNLPKNIEWDGTLAYVSQLRDAGFGSVPGYLRLDTRLARRFGESIEVSIVGQNLLAPRHSEFTDNEGIIHSPVARSVFGKLVWRF